MISWFEWVEATTIGKLVAGAALTLAGAIIQSVLSEWAKWGARREARRYELARFDDQLICDGLRPLEEYMALFMKYVVKLHHFHMVAEEKDNLSEFQDVAHQTKEGLQRLNEASASALIAVMSLPNSKLGEDFKLYLLPVYEKMIEFSEQMMAATETVRQVEDLDYSGIEEILGELISAISKMRIEIHRYRRLVMRGEEKL